MPSRRLTRPALALLAGAAVAVPLASCGAEDLDPASVAEAAEASADAGSARFRYTADFDGQAAEGSGYYALDPLRMRMTVRMPGLGEVEAVADEETMFFEVPEDISEAFGAGGARWVSVDMAAAGGLGGDAVSGQLGSADPAKQLEMLKAMSDAEEIGEEEIDGVPTTRLSGDLDLRETVQFADPADRASLQAGIDQFAKTNGGSAIVPVEVWVDDESLVRRMRQSFGGEPSGTMTMDLYDYGAEEDVQIPSSDEAVDVTEELAP